MQLNARTQQQQNLVPPLLLSSEVSHIGWLAQTL